VVLLLEMDDVAVGLADDEGGALGTGLAGLLDGDQGFVEDLGLAGGQADGEGVAHPALGDAGVGLLLLQGLALLELGVGAVEEAGGELEIHLDVEGEVLLLEEGADAGVRESLGPVEALEGIAAEGVADGERGGGAGEEAQELDEVALARGVRAEDAREGRERDLGAFERLEA
jgi:hypothetical protein